MIEIVLTIAFVVLFTTGWFFWLEAKRLGSGEE